MRRRMAVLAIVVLVALLAATPVMAGGKRNQNQQGNLNRVGTGVGAVEHHGVDGDFKVRAHIVSLDEPAIKLEIVYPLWFAAEFGEITVLTTEDTKIAECDNGTCTRIDFDDLEEGWSVRVQGTVEGGVYTAVRIAHNVDFTW